MDFERIRDFIISFQDDEDSFLNELRLKSENEGVPIIRKDAEQWIRFLLKQIKPERVLEIGMAVGYSAIVMAEELSKLGDAWHIDTCELEESMIQRAGENMKAAGFDYGITIHSGDASATLDGLTGKVYDFIFIDAAKAQYMDYLKKALKLSHPGTMIVTDNIFEDGKVLESHFLVEKRDRTIHDRLKEYIHYITHTHELDTVLLPVGDGMALSVVL